MLGRKSYEKEEVARGRANIRAQLDAYAKLAGNAPGPARDDFDRQFFNNMILVLDRPFVHRLRGSTGKDGNALNEVELIVESLLNNDGVFRGNNVIQYDAGKSVVKLSPGQRIQLTESDFDQLSEAFFTELEKRFL
jgi:hypothetical protein